MSVQGYLKIKTKIDNNEIDKGITELENKIKKLQTENMDNSDNERQIIEQLKEEDNMYGKLTQKVEGYKKELERLNAERNKIPTNSSGLPTAQHEEWGNLTESITQNNGKLASTYSEMSEIGNEATRLFEQLDKVQAKQEKNNEQISKFKQKIEQIKLKKVQDSIDSVGKSIQNSISKVGKLAMAVVGIKTAWGLVRSAMNTVAQYNPQIAADIEYIKYALANTLLPIIQKLISYAYTLLNYINAIVNAWFGINLFANSSADAFQKMKSGATGTAKAAKEIKKSLQGFDEMNILQDTSDSSSGGGTSSVTPSMSIGEIQGEVPSWLQWIMDNGEIVRKILEAIGGALIGIKLGLGGIKGLGIGLIIDGIINLVNSIQDFTNNPTVKKFGEILAAIGEILLGLAVVIKSIPLAIIGQIAMAVGGIVQWIGALVDFIKEPSWKKWTDVIRGGIKSTGILGYAIDWLVENIAGGWDNITNILKNVGGWIYNNVINPVEDLLQGLWEKINKIFEPTIEFFKNIFDTVWENVQIVGEDIHQVFSVLWENIKQVFDPAIGWFKGTFEKAYEAVKKVFEPIGKFFEGIWNTIKSKFSDIGQKIGEVVGRTFKSAVNAVLSTMENVLNAPIRAINGLTDVINMIPGMNLGHLNTFSLPRLAKGGIIAQPTTAIIGESGKEAVLPLENNLEYLDILADKIASKLGSTGGSYIIQMDGRTIQRGIAKKRQELAFATNGR